MPIYEYRCPECGAEFERYVPSSDTRVACAECGAGEVLKRASTFAASSGGSAGGG